MRIILSGILAFIGMITLQKSAMIYSDSKLKEKEGKTSGEQVDKNVIKQVVLIAFSIFAILMASLLL